MKFVMNFFDSPFMLAISRAAAIQCWCVPVYPGITRLRVNESARFRKRLLTSQIFSFTKYFQLHDVMKPKQDDALEMFACVEKVS